MYLGMLYSEEFSKSLSVPGLLPQGCLASHQPTSYSTSLLSAPWKPSPLGSYKACYGVKKAVIAPVLASFCMHTRIISICYRGPTPDRRLLLLQVDLKISAIKTYILIHIFVYAPCSRIICQVFLDKIQLPRGQLWNNPRKAIHCLAG
jgi:hypothetical protein